MWIRDELKDRAKNVLRKNYWKAFLISWVMGLVVGGTTSLGYRVNNYDFTKLQNTFELDAAQWMMILAGVASLVAILSIFGLAIQILVGLPLEVGGRRFFVRSAQGDINMSYLGYSFTNDRYLDIVKAMAWRLLFNTLWYFLFFIPGIVKGYAYMMVPYILNDNPNIGYKRALTLSMQMTDGFKGDIFVLDLSFIGWYLLGALACCVGTIFVNPYVNATKAELYLTMRQNAIQNGLCTAEELHLNTEPAVTATEVTPIP